MSYQDCLERAGATVHKFKSFGDYQGQWWAKVTYKGVTGWVNGSFGSCSGCDAFHHEFDYSVDHPKPGRDNDWEEHSRYDDDFPFKDCPECDKVVERMVKFGENYLNDLLTQAEAEKEAMPSWKDWQDEDDTEVLNFLKENAL